MTTISTHSNVNFSQQDGPRWVRSLRARLLISVNLVVALMVAGALILDYRHQLATELSAYQSALSDEARSLLPGIVELQHHGIESVQRYVDAVCATMQDESSPGHHIVVDLGESFIQAQTHHRASDANLARILDAAASPDGRIRTGGVPIVVGDARNGDLHAYVAEESEPVIARIRGQELARLIAVLGIGVTGAVLVNIILVRLVTRPIGDLVRVVHRIDAGELGAVPNRFKTDDLDALATEIGRMSTHLALRERDRAAHLNKAQRLQSRLLPRFEPEDDVPVAVVYRPADTVAGDYYDVLTLPDGSTLVCVADVCGHGVPAAMGAAILKTLLLSACERFDSLPAVLHYINERFLRVSLPEDFASMVVIRVSSASGLLEFASAGHEPCYLLHDSGEIQQLDSTGMLLGISDGGVWECHRSPVSRTDRLILLTDGVTEAPDTTGRLFGRPAISGLLTTLAAQPVDKIARTIMSALDQHCANAAVGDDQTILVLQPDTTLIESQHGSDTQFNAVEGSSR